MIPQQTQILLRDLGVMDYRSAWDLQEKLFAEIVDRKIKTRNGEAISNPKSKIQNHLLLLEHPHVITLGRNGEMKNLIAQEEMLNARHVSFFKTNRGGDITYHGPGQLVGYPILDLDFFFTDIGKYLRLLEQSIIDTMAEYGLKGERSPGETGVWMETNSPSRARKICAIGVRCSRWVTMHGFAFNINTDLDFFNLIIPCGIQGKQVTSLQKELGREIEMNEVKEKFISHFATNFNAELIRQTENIPA